MVNRASYSMKVMSLVLLKNIFFKIKNVNVQIKILKKRGSLLYIFRFYLSICTYSIDITFQKLNKKGKI